MIKEENKKIKVLHILNSFSVNGGGAETFIMNVYRCINKNNFSLNFLLRSEINNKDYIEEIKNNGDKIFITPSFPKHFLKNFRETKRIIISENYDVIHVHANALIYIYPIIFAKRANIPIIIIHSHNTTSPFGFLGKLIHSVNKRFIHKFASHFIACGQEAGKWMFGKRNFTVINNSININQYLYNEELRNRIRIRYGLNDKFVIGHVGRFTEQKNHNFLIKIFREYQKINKNSVLLLVGDGELMCTIKKQVEEYNLSDYVIFTGAQNNINELMSAMDIFVFPSLYEGLPFVLVEAQASGLDVISSDKVTTEVNVSGLIRYISLGETEKKWAEEIELISKKKSNRYIDCKIMDKYDMGYTINTLEKIYKEK